MSFLESINCLPGLLSMQMQLSFFVFFFFSPFFSFFSASFCQETSFTGQSMKNFFHYYLILCFLGLA